MKLYVPKPKLLLVDDDIACNLIIKEILENTNITVIEAFDCKQAISLFREYSKEIGLVIIDIVLPDGDGVSLLNKFQVINSFVPAIALSAIEPDLLVQKCKNSNFNACLSKPFDFDRFAGIIFSYISCNAIVVNNYIGR